MIGRLLLVLRWVALAIAFLLNLWDPAPAGFAHEPEAWVFAVAVYNAIASLAQVRWNWVTPHRLLIADSLIFTAGVVVTGGWHSSLFALYFLIVLSSALQLSVLVSLAYTVAVSLVYFGACIVLPNWVWDLQSVEVLASRVTGLLFAELIALALTQQVDAERRLRKVEQDVNARLTVLNELMSLELGSKLDLGRTLDGIARLARRAISAEFSAVCLFPDKDESDFRMAFDGVPAPQQGKLFREAHLDPIGEVVVRTGQPLLVADVSRAGGEVPSVSTFYKCRTLICVPIKLEDAVIGVLYNGARSPEQIDQNDVDLLVAMGRHAALAIANAEMYDRERTNVVRLEKLEQAKSEFLSTVSHQLRTPITSIATSADLLMDSGSALNDDQKRLLQNIARNSVRLDNLVTDLLQMARLKEGRIQLSLQPISPATLISDALTSVKLLIDARDQRVEIDADPNLPKVEADRKRIEHVLINLLFNACKYTQRGGLITVEARDLGGELEFAVRDNGPGMEIGIQERAFEPFYSAAGPEGQGGTGLGLAIAKGLVELHGGDISLESIPGTGTSVRFTLAISQQQPAIRNQTMVDSSSLTVDS